MTRLSVEEIIDGFKTMTLTDVTTFIKQFEETFGVTAQPEPPIQVLGDPPVEAVEEQTEFDVTLEAAGDKKINVIKAVREILHLGLKDAKDFVDSAPKTVLTQVAKHEAEAARDKMVAAGATVTVK